MLIIDAKIEYIISGYFPLPLSAQKHKKSAINSESSHIIKQIINYILILHHPNRVIHL